MIKIKISHTYFGPNPLALGPVVVLSVTFDKSLLQNNQRVGAAFAEYFNNWWKDIPQYDPKDPALYLAQLLVQWSLAALNEVRGFIRHGGARKTTDGLELWIGFHDPQLSISCVALAAQCLLDVCREDIPKKKIESALTDFWKRCRTLHPDFQAKILMDAAVERDIPFLRFIPRSKYWQYGWGKASRVMLESTSREDSHLGIMLAKTKLESKQIFAAMGMPIAQHVMVNTEDELPAAVTKVGWPCVVKPIDRGGANGVTANVRSAEELTAAFKLARSRSGKSIMVESHVHGYVYRLLIIRGVFYAATRRRPAYVTGDGVSTVIQLAQAYNDRRTQASTPGSYLGPVPFDESMKSSVEKQGLQLDSVVPEDQEVTLYEIPLQGTGANNVDVTDIVHPDIKQVAVSLAQTFGIAICGIDYISEDISKSYLESGAFLEINNTPSMRGHLVDNRDIRQIGSAVLGDDLSRIPLNLYVVEPTLITPRLRLSSPASRQGWVISNTVGIGETELIQKTPHLYRKVETLLKNRIVESVTLICTADELMAEGLPVDRVDHIFLQDSSVNQAWREVFTRCSRQITEVSDFSELQQQLSLMEK